MIRRSATKGTKVYHCNLGCYGTLTGNINPKDINLVEVEFDDFFQYCHRHLLIEVEESD